MATVAKKKRSGEAGDLEDEAAAKRLRLQTGERQEEASEEKVEEFFAIVRRIRDSAASFAAGRGGVARRSPGSAKEPEGRSVPAWRWRPSFEWEDFREATEGAEKAKKRKTPPSPAEIDGEEEEEEVDDHEEEVEEPAAEDGLRRCFDLNLEPSASEESPSVALSRR